MAPSFLEMINMGDPDLRSVDVKDDEFRIPAQEMKAWRNIQATVCSFCSKSQIQKFLCGKVCRVLEYLCGWH